MAKREVKKKGANGYKMPDPLPKGEVLTDIAKKRWKLGDSIGKGGFGEIYSAQDADFKGSIYPYVVKIEPHENGPLFVEINFYIRNAKPQDVEDFKKQKKLKTIGMPVYLGSGSHEHKNVKYRFLVMHKFGSDIWKLFLENRVFPNATVFKLGVQLLDVLEYIHECGYVHADIKGANVLLGVGKEAKDQVYLVDFGLATKYQNGDVFKPNPKKAHDGTIEYLSRDAHQGVPTRRGDLEILAYNMIQWLGCTLPWEKITNPPKVQEMKEAQMSNPKKFLDTCFTSNSPVALLQFLNHIKELTFDAKPDYEKIKKLFVNEIEKSGAKITSQLSFKNEKQTPSKRKLETKKTAAKKLKKDENDDENEQQETKKVTTTRTKRVQAQEEDDEHEETKKVTTRRKRGAKAEVEDDEQEETQKVTTGRKRGINTEVEDDEHEEPKKVTTERKRVAKAKDDDQEETEKVITGRKRGVKAEDDKQEEPKKVTTGRKRGVKAEAEEREETKKTRNPKQALEGDEENEEKPESKRNIATRRGATKKLKEEVETKDGKVETNGENEFEGYTAEMKALALKKAQNGVKKKKPSKKSNKTET